MANPRQRRKQRSSSASGSSATSKKAQRKKLHRAPPIKGPAAAIIGEHWDRTKTITQNYRALGLVGNALSLRPSGGAEKNAAEYVHRAPPSSSSSSSSSASANANGNGKANEEAPLRKGLGRIIRDDQGNVIDIIEGGEHDSPLPTNAPTPWGKPFNDWDDIDDTDTPVQTARAYIPERLGPQTQAGQQILSSLEQRAAEAAPVIRHTSALEADWLHALVHAHGDDLEAMARDTKRNVWQKTVGEIRRAIKKAGGKEALLP